MATTLDTIVRTAAANGWTTGYSDTAQAHTFTRGTAQVRVRMTARNAVAMADHTDDGMQYSVVGGRDAGKRAIVLAWLSVQAYPVPTAADAAVTAADPFTAAPVQAYPVPVAPVDAQPERTDNMDAADADAESAHWQAVDAAIADARVLITDAVLTLASMERIATGFQWAPSASAPDTYDGLVDAYLSGCDVQDDGGTAYLPVYDGASDHTLYMTPAANHAFRYWHDMGHATERLTFTPEDERRLQIDHHIPAMERMGVTRHSLAWWLYYADTIGQIEYNVARGAFPVDQFAFCVDYALDVMDGGNGTYAVYAADYSTPDATHSAADLTITQH